jgi:parallel beta helix pectate lyase-like protein
MSYTLRGRIESRLAALALPLAAAFVLSALTKEWWPVQLGAVMAVVGLALDVGAYHPVLSYQPAWAAVPLGLLELAAIMAIVLGFHIQAPLAVALGLFGAAWLCAQVLGQAVLPWWRMSYAEDGGELGRTGVTLAVTALLPFLASGAIWYAHLPPTVHLAAGIHRGPLVIDRRERLVGEHGAIVVGGIVVRHSDVTISHVSVVGGENGIVVDEFDHVVLDHVTVARSQLDGIHVRRAAVTIEHCFVDMRGVHYGQGIDISYATDKGESVVKDCRVVGGQEGIVTHSAMAVLKDNHVENTSLRGISMTEMSMGSVERNTVRNANGVGILCGDHSMCMIERNDVAGTRVDTAGGDLTRAGFGILAQFYAEAELSGNELAANPSRLGVVSDATVRWDR